MLELAASCALIAGEIVRADGVAEIGPAACTPVIDHARSPHQRLESLRPSQRSRGWMPKRFVHPASFLGGLLRIIKHAFRSANIGVDEAQLGTQGGEFRGLIGFSWSGTHQP